MSAYHTPAMLEEVLEYLNPHGGGVWVDLTVGGGGHARAICERLAPEAVLVGFDRDPRALDEAGSVLQGVPCRVALRRAHFKDAAGLLGEFGTKASGALGDLGLSSSQLDRNQGFSVNDLSQALDMRQDPDQEKTAALVLNSYEQAEIADLIFYNSDERLSRRIASQIVSRRPLMLVGDLVEAVRSSLPRGYRHVDDTMRRVFQAVRIEVNDELVQLTQTLRDITDLLEPGARIVILSYHSGEDRLVKQFFRQGKLDKRLRVLTPKPLRPTDDEVRQNSRARPAHLRAAEKID